MHFLGISCAYFWTWMILLVGPNSHVTPYPTSIWKDWIERYSTASRSNEGADPQAISYRLDFWSQYDNPEEGTAREGDIQEIPPSRKATTTVQNLLWPDGLVRYFVDQSIVNEPTKLRILEDAMKDIMESSCVKFQRIFPDDNGTFPSDTWVNITGNQKGCFSDLGRSTMTPSNLNLDVNRCFRLRGHALHEILHTLGIYHEHMRPDRDEFINILWDNVKEGEAFNFHILDNHMVTTYGLPYDYDSVMHYSMTAFSKNRSVPTIVPMKQHIDIGQRDHLSLHDVQKLLITYKCNDMDKDSLYRRLSHDYGDNLDSYNLTDTSTSPIVDSFDWSSDSYSFMYEIDNRDLYHQQGYTNSDNPDYYYNNYDESSQENGNDAVPAF